MGIDNCRNISNSELECRTSSSFKFILGVSIKTPTFVLFYIFYKNDQICTKISLNAAE